MQVAFPAPVRVRSSVPRLDGLRLDPFTNIDGEAFAKPTLNGFWRIDMSVFARDMAGHLGLSAFITQMSAGGTSCVVPLCAQWRPNDATGRPLSGGGVSPVYTFDHTGWASDPFDGFKIRNPVSHRDSYIDINEPDLSKLWPGHYLSLDDRLYQVTNVTPIIESEHASRVSVMPNIRGNHPAGKIVVVDQLRLRCMMESGDQISHGIGRFRTSSISFVEAF